MLLAVCMLHVSLNILNNQWFCCFRNPATPPPLPHPQNNTRAQFLLLSMEYGTVETSRALSIGTVFFVFLFFKQNKKQQLTFESSETLSAAIFCPAFCINDVTNNAGMCGKGIKYVIGRSFLLFSAQPNQHGCAPRSSKSWEKILLFYKYWSNNQMKQADENICTFSVILCQLASSGWFPFDNKNSTLTEEEALNSTSVFCLSNF